MYTRLFGVGYGYASIQRQGVELGRAVAPLVRLLIMHLCHHPRPLCYALFAMHCLLCTVYYALHNMHCVQCTFWVCIGLILHLCHNSGPLSHALFLDLHNSSIFLKISILSSCQYFVLFTFVFHLCPPFVHCTTPQVVCLPFLAQPCYFCSFVLLYFFTSPLLSFCTT